jgi:hypothetical protein
MWQFGTTGLHKPFPYVCLITALDRVLTTKLAMAAAPIVGGSIPVRKA